MSSLRRTTKPLCISVNHTILKAFSVALTTYIASDFIVFSFFIIQCDASVCRYCSAFYIKNKIPTLRVFLMTDNQTALHICKSYHLEGISSSFKHISREPFYCLWFFQNSLRRERMSVDTKCYFSESALLHPRIRPSTRTESRSESRPAPTDARGRAARAMCRFQRRSTSRSAVRGRNPFHGHSRICSGSILECP